MFFRTTYRTTVKPNSANSPSAVALSTTVEESCTFAAGLVCLLHALWVPKGELRVN